MGMHAPIPTNHNSLSNCALGLRVSEIEADTEATIRKARWAQDMKARLVLKIPYHEWAAALERNRTGELIEAYRPRYMFALKDFADAPRCPPWASRKYRGAMPDNMDEIIAHVGANIDRLSGAWGSLRGSFERSHGCYRPSVEQWRSIKRRPRRAKDVVRGLQAERPRGLRAGLAGKWARGGYSGLRPATSAFPLGLESPAWPYRRRVEEWWRAFIRKRGGVWHYRALSGSAPKALVPHSKSFCRASPVVARLSLHRRAAGAWPAHWSEFTRTTL